MTWLRSNWLWVLLAVLGVGMVSALTSRAKWLGVAEAAEQRAGVLADSVAALSALNADRLAQVQARDSAYREDSLRWQAERAELRVRAVEAGRRASGLADALRPRLDSIGAALLAEYEAEIQREREAHAQVVLSLDANITALRERVAQRDELIAGLRAELDLRARENAELRAANEALRNAVSPSFFTRIFDSWETHAAVAALTYGIAQIGP